MTSVSCRKTFRVGADLTPPKREKKKKSSSKSKKKLQRVTIYLTPDQVEYLDDVANKIKVKRSTYIRMLIDTEMKGPILSPSQQHQFQMQHRTFSPAAYVPPRRRKVGASASSGKVAAGKMKAHAELMNELKNVLKKRKVDGDGETATLSSGLESSSATTEDNDVSMEKKKTEKWKEKAKWATPPPPPPPPSS